MKLNLFILATILISLFPVHSLTSSLFPNSTNSTENANEESPLIPSSLLPVNWTYAQIHGKNMLTLIRNQDIPNYCISGWVMATTSMISDRIKFKRNGAWPDFVLSAQFILACDQQDMGCNGGDPIGVLEYIYNYSIPDETCSSYQARGWTNGADCDACMYCSTCNTSDSCAYPSSYNIY